MARLFNGAADLDLKEFREACRDAHIARGGLSSIRTRIQSIYQEHNPRKIADIDALLMEWQGDENKLLAQVEAKYTSTTRSEAAYQPQYSLQDVQFCEHVQSHLRQHVDGVSDE